jgi:hypothetical protein
MTRFVPEGTQFCVWGKVLFSSSGLLGAGFVHHRRANVAKASGFSVTSSFRVSRSRSKAGN